MASAYQTLELLIAVKAYPTLSSKYGEAVCVAGIRCDTSDPEWVRLFPIQFRDLPQERQFKKYQMIRVRATKHGTDRRLESWRPDPDSIEPGRVISADGSWGERRRLIEPMLGPTMCELNEGRKGGADGQSLGIIQPADVKEITVDAEEEWSDAQTAKQRQTNLLATKAELVKPKHRFSYRYVCKSPGCREHRQKIVDWELGEAYRTWPHRDDADLINQIRTRWLDHMCAEAREPFFFVGDQHHWPGQFLVLGTFYPRLTSNPGQLALL